MGDPSGPSSNVAGNRLAIPFAAMRSLLSFTSFKTERDFYRMVTRGAPTQEFEGQFEVKSERGKLGLPHEAIPDIRLESGRCWPASGLAGAQRRAEQTLAARSSRVPAGDSRARNAA